MLIAYLREQTKGQQQLIAGELKLPEHSCFFFTDLTNKLNYAKDAEVRASKACLPGTRVELLARIQNWALHPEKCTLLLYGAAGTGKSAIVHKIGRASCRERV